MTERPPHPHPVRPTRAEPREIVELKQIRSAQPELASAVNMQIELLDIQRRVQGRVPLPWIQPDPKWLQEQLRAGRPAVRFGDIPLEWSDFRLALRQIADVLYRHEAIERDDHERMLADSRDGHALVPLVQAWYLATSHVDGDVPMPEELPAGVAHVLLLSLRPFLTRCGESLLQRVDFAAWHEGHCPICGWEPDFAVITPSAERRLICGRCVAQWPFDPIACPFCRNDDRSRITSFATRDGRYRVAGCDACKRYIKAYDGRNAPRPVMVVVDSIATLPLDAAAMQRGYSS